MTKNSDAKASVQTNSQTALEKEVHSIGQRTTRLSASAGESIDPQEAIVRGTAMMEQCDQAGAKHESPKLLEWNGQANLLAKTVFAYLVAHATTAVNKPGGRTPRADAPKVSPIELALEGGEKVRRRTSVAAEGSPLEAEKNAKITSAIFGDRPAPSGKVRMIAELTSMSTAIREMPDAPAAVSAMLPAIEDALAAVQAAQPLPPGRPASSFVYSDDAIRAALMLELAIGDFRAWAAAHASDSRYAAILRAISPKRQTDTKPDTPAAPAQGAQPAAPAAPAAPAEGAQPVAPAAAAAHSNGATPHHEVAAVTATA